jgi:hypothetical protein
MRRVLAVAMFLGACADEPGVQPDPEPSTPEELGPLAGEVTYVVPPYEVAPGADELRCVSVTLHNEEPLYVAAVRSENEGGFHHGNWFIVPQDVYEGEDGYWECGAREFEEIAAAMSGTVLFAQSTQALAEEQRFAEGAVIRIPARAKIVADVHLLNASPRPLSTRVWLTLELVHPSLVETVLSPIILSYFDLLIPAGTQTRHRGVCGAEEHPWPRMKFHYVLPHFHGFGDFFDLEVIDAQDVSTSIYARTGFDAQSLGVTLDPPLAVEAGSRVSFTCGYDNWMSTDLEWGLGDGEMCVVLALVEADALVVGGVVDGRTVVDVVDGVRTYEGECLWGSTPRGLTFSMPRDYELRTPLYLPPIEDAGAPPPPACRDADRVDPVVEPTLIAIEEHVFTPSCTFSSCHGDAVSGGLDLRPPVARDALLDHVMQRPTDQPLIAPGEPDRSYLVEILSHCTPAAGPPMPANSPTLLEDGVIALVREWIAAGAP